MFAKNDEEKRNRLWKTVMAVSTVLIIIIVVFFIIRLFTSNPLEGTWLHEDSDLRITIENDGTARIVWPEKFDDSQEEAVMEYTVDKDMKTLTLSQNEAQKQEDADLAALVEDGLGGTYSYSIEQNEMTLTEREYGSQMIFERE